MKYPAINEFIKITIDILFKPFKKSKIFLQYLFNHTLKKELADMLKKGEIFPCEHIHRSISLAKKLSDQNYIILDIGGGIGASVLLYSKFLPENKIFVFEPIHENYITIKSKVSNLSNIEVCNFGLGNENSKKQINIANRITSSSLLPLSADPDSEFLNQMNLGQKGVESIEIKRLDDYLAKIPDAIGIMKIDVQGYEMEVLRGSEATLNKTKIVLLEVNNHEGYSGSAKYYEIDNYLREHNFTLYDILTSVLDNGMLKEWDVIYINNSALCELGS
jgi:FkbM family methyltransferase